jgi:hypothetical protein
MKAYLNPLEKPIRETAAYGEFLDAPYLIDCETDRGEGESPISWFDDVGIDWHVEARPPALIE